MEGGLRRLHHQLQTAGPLQHDALHRPRLQGLRRRRLHRRSRVMTARELATPEHPTPILCCGTQTAFACGCGESNVQPLSRSLATQCRKRRSEKCRGRGTPSPAGGLAWSTAGGGCLAGWQLRRTDGDSSVAHRRNGTGMSKSQPPTGHTPSTHKNTINGSMIIKKNTQQHGHPARCLNSA